jgi:hypothetical protein
MSEAQAFPLDSTLPASALSGKQVCRDDCWPYYIPMLCVPALCSNAVTGGVVYLAIITNSTTGLIKKFISKKRHDLSSRQCMIVPILTKEIDIMFWAFILLVILGVVFVKLGAYSVWVVILSGALKLGAIFTFCVFVWLFFRKKIE